MRSPYLKPVFAIMVVSLLAVSCGKNEVDNNLCNDYPKPVDTYTFPIVPGTPAWVNLKPAERLPAVQISADVINKLSTDALVQSWLDFPLRSEIYAGNEVQRFVEFYIQNFNGLAELVKRNDAGTVLSKRYQSINPACISGLSGNTQAEFELKNTLIDVLFAQDQILAQLSIEQKKLLVTQLLKQYEAKVASGINIESTLFLGAKVMIAAGYAPFTAEMQRGNLVHSLYLALGLPANTVILAYLKNFVS